MNTITAAIDRSIRHDEIVTVDLSDLTIRLQSESIGAGDTDMGDYCAVLIDVLRGDGSESDYDGCITYAEAESAVVRCLLDCGGMDVYDTDDVENGAVWEMWGTTEDGDYRVHIRLDR